MPNLDTVLLNKQPDANQYETFQDFNFYSLYAED